jgi:hypothetical protein
MVSIHLSCYNKYTTDLVDYKQQEVISHTTGSWEAQDQGPCPLRAYSLFIEN